MDSKRASILIAALALAAGAFRPLTRAAAPPAATEKPAAHALPRTQTGACSNCFQHVINEHFDVRDENPPADLARALGNQHRAGALDLRFLVATVPDPLDSALGYQFDRAADALERAVEAYGYVRDRFWLPWRPDEARADTADEATGSDCHLHHCQTTEPGVIVFRGPAGPRPSVLILFLVGETPTTGLQKPALGRALDFIAAAGETEARIVGPQFSGSISSLIDTLRQWTHTAERKLKLTVVSGSATNRHNLEAVEAFRAEGVDIHFSATTIPDDVTMRELYAYLVGTMKLRPTDCVLDDVAVLVEGNTSYGSSFVSHRKRGEACDSGFEPALYVQFPSNISRLRSAYEKQNASDAASKSSADDTPGLKPIDTGLSLSLDERHATRDALPSYSQITQSSDDLVLNNLLSTISRLRTRYVGLIATDTLDELFLAELIRKYCPDVRLFTFGNDILFANPTYSAYFEGMIVASSYPLFDVSLARKPRGTQSAVRQFPSSVAEGTYNAAVLQLARAGEAAPLVDYSTPDGAADRPPVWLSIVSNGALWPLTYLPSRPEDPYVAPAPQPGVPGEIIAENLRPSRFWSLIFFLAAVFCGLSAAGFLLVRNGVPDASKRGFWPELERECRAYLVVFESPPGDRGAHRFLVAIYFTMLLGLYALLGSVAAIPTLMQMNGFWQISIGVVQLTLGSVLTALIATPILVAALRLPWRPTLGAMMVVVTVLSFFLPQLSSALIPGHESLALFYQRVTDFSSGLSPVLPFLLLGAVPAAGLYVLLTRARLLRHWPENPLGTPPVAEAEGRVRRLLLRPLSRPALAGAVVLLSAFPIYQVIFKRVLMIEGRIIEGYWGGLLFMLLLFVAWTLIVSVFVWFLGLVSELRRLLRRLAAHPLVGAYDRMSHELAKTVASQFAARGPRRSQLSVPIEQLRALANASAGLTDGDGNPLASLVRAGGAQRGARLLQRVASLVERHFAAEMVARGGSERLDLRPSAALGLLSAISRRLSRALEDYWRARPHSPALESWARLAEDVVASQVVLFLGHLFVHLRNFLSFVTGAMLLVLLAVISYPFQPERMLMMLAWSSIGGVTILSVASFVSLERDEVLSRIAKTKPGEITWERAFIVRVLVYGALPLLGLISAEFPSVGRTLFSWVAPVLRILH